MVTDEDRRVMRECISESKFRSSAAAVFTALNVRFFIRNRKLWLNGWPVVLGSSCLAWFVGKLSYIRGKHCQDKFIEKAPDSKITEQILLSRAAEKMTPSREEEPSNEEISDSQTVVGMRSEEENSTLRKCNSTAFWEYSLPIMTAVSFLGKDQNSYEMSITGGGFSNRKYIDFVISKV